MNSFNRNSGFGRQRNIQSAPKKNDFNSKDVQEKSSISGNSSADHRTKPPVKRPFVQVRNSQQSVKNDEQRSSEKRLDDLVNTASRQLNTSPEELKNAAQNGNMQKLFSQMSPSQAQQLQKILSDENAAKKLLSTPQAQALLRGLSKNE